MWHRVPGPLRPSLRSGKDAEGNRISDKIETNSVTKGKICLHKYEVYEEIFVLPRDVDAAVLVWSLFL